VAVAVVRALSVLAFSCQGHACIGRSGCVCSHGISDTSYSYNVESTSWILSCRLHTPLLGLDVRALISSQTGGKELFLCSCEFGIGHSVCLESLVLSLLDGLPQSRRGLACQVGERHTATDPYLGLLFASIPRRCQVLLVLLHPDCLW
jgi:hypothetical protein